MILATLLLLQTPTPTLADVLRLPPRRAGDLLLAGQDHRPIDTVAVAPSRGPAPPGVEEVHLVERAAAAADGCTRRRWTVSFHYKPGNDRGEARLSTAYAAVEVALPGTGGCNAATPFVHVNPGLDAAEAIRGLRQLRQTVSPSARAGIACTDATRSDLCDGGNDAVRRRLQALTPWAVSRQGNDTVFWLGMQGGIVTEVRFAPGSPDRVIVDRRVPAPF